jgi:hypothetical protein
MTRIPIDLAAPIACTASRDDLHERIAQLERLRDRLRSVERTEQGLVLHLEPGADVRAALERFVADEKGCCQFWGFEICDGRDLTLRWEGPPAVQPLLGELHDCFRSGEPLHPLAGLL